jgi:hypothetical protein
MQPEFGQDFATAKAKIGEDEIIFNGILLGHRDTFLGRDKMARWQDDKVTR